MKKITTFLILFVIIGLAFPIWGFSEIDTKEKYRIERKYQEKLREYNLKKIKDEIMQEQIKKAEIENLEKTRENLSFYETNKILIDLLKNGYMNLLNTRCYLKDILEMLGSFEGFDI